MRKSSPDRYITMLTKSLVLSFLITLVFFVIYALILTYSSLSESTIPAVNTAIMITSVSAGSISMTKKVHNRGWLNGGLVGILYMIVIVIFSSLYNRTFCMDSYVFIKSLIGLFSGVISGIIGINLK
ncbi:TIGR04086 family membrane protein [Clostridiaceae bacterium M8S5]|nr:TIGR04086 family membrane protein [Clostridiaceae bacterium M8S5]